MKMKKVITVVLTLILAISAYAGAPAGALYHDGGLQVNTAALITDNRINIRTEPATSGKVLGQLNAGDIVTVLAIYDEQMEAEGAYAHWVKIQSEYITGYICGRWMTSYFFETKKGTDKSEYLAYEFFYKLPEDYDPALDSYDIVKDNIIHITASNIYIINDITFVPTDGSSFVPPEMSVVEGTGLSEDPVLLFRAAYRDDGSIHAAVTFCAWNGDSSLKKIVSADGFDEVLYYRKPVIHFPSKYYDVVNDAWLRPTEGTRFVVKVEERTYTNNRWVITDTEYLP